MRPRPIGVLVALLSATLAAGVVAASPQAPEPVPVVGLAITAAPGDSARVVARWRIRCDVRGCADSVRVTWTVAGVARPAKFTRTTVDTLHVSAPPWGDSLRVTVAVAAVRRGLTSESQTVSYVVRAADLAPPAPDSVRVDTLANVLAAERDSMPVIVFRDTLGRSAGDYQVGDVFTVCALARHRYTGEIRVLVAAEAPAFADTVAERVCERARQSYALERAG